MSEDEKEKVKKVQFAANVELPTEAGMLCTIDGETFHLFKNKWIGDSGTLCQITNNYSSLFEVTEINKLIQGNSDSMPAIEKGKLHIHVQQVDGNKQSTLYGP